MSPIHVNDARDVVDNLQARMKTWKRVSGIGERGRSRMSRWMPLFACSDLVVLSRRRDSHVCVLCSTSNQPHTIDSKLVAFSRTDRFILSSCGWCDTTSFKDTGMDFSIRTLLARSYARRSPSPVNYAIMRGFVTKEPHDVELLKSSSECFWQPEPAPHETGYTDSAKQVACLSFPVAFITAEHVRHTDSEDDTKQRLYSCRNGNDWTDSHLINEGPYIHESCLSPDCSRIMVRRPNFSINGQERQLCLLEKICRIANERIASDHLNQVHHGTDLSPPQICSLETVEISRTCFIFTLEQVCFLDQDKHCFKVRTIPLAGQFFESVLCIVSTPLAYQPAKSTELLVEMLVKRTQGGTLGEVELTEWKFVRKLTDAVSTPRRANGQTSDA
ncbi:hypothetical protein KCU90_g103, partial [Aureobasidium melanogenum]